MTRVEAYHILGDLWFEVTSKEAEAITIAQEAVQFVDLMPNDMVHVVRCKDCKHASVRKQTITCPYYEDQGVDPEHFCSDGERKEGADEDR